MRKSDHLVAWWLLTVLLLVGHEVSLNWYRLHGASKIDRFKVHPSWKLKTPCTIPYTTLSLSRSLYAYVYIHANQPESASQPLLDPGLIEHFRFTEQPRHGANREEKRTKLLTYVKHVVQMIFEIGYNSSMVFHILCAMAWHNMVLASGFSECIKKSFEQHEFKNIELTFRLQDCLLS